MLTVEQNKLPVIVIGAGISGLTCARKLHESGKEVIVLEAKDRIGGRLHSVQNENDVFDLGASWIHGIDGNPIWEITQSKQIETVVFNYDDSDYFHEDGQQFSLDEKQEFQYYFDVVEKLLLTSTQNSALVSVREILNNLKMDCQYFDENQLKHLIFTFFEKYANDPYATELYNLHSQYQLHEGYYEGDEVIFPLGYSQILNDSLCDIGLNIKTNVIVKKIIYEGDVVKVIDHNNIEYLASQLVVSVPLGVLKKQAITFIPELPETYQYAIDAIGFGSFNKIFFELEESLDLQKNSDANSFYYWVGSTWYNILDLSKIYKKPVYLLLFGGKLSEYVDGATNKDVWSFIHRNLSTSLANLPMIPKRLCITRWGADAFSYGSFSFPSIFFNEKLVKTLNEPIHDRIYFTGEHCSAEYAGTVHGAYLNGIETADQI
jgi:monoamine oxidase